jgi:hypothetical protein
MTFWVMKQTIFELIYPQRSQNLGKIDHPTKAQVTIHVLSFIVKII